MKTFISKISFKRFTILFVALFIVTISHAQTQYVFMRNNNSGTYYYANGATWSSANSFSPSYIWTVNDDVPSNNGRYLIISRSGDWYSGYTYTPSLSTTSNDDYTLTYNDASIISGTLYYNWRSSATHYLPYGFGNLGRNTGADDRVIAYQVSTSSVDATSTAPTISGNDVLTATRNYTYNHATAAYQAGYTNYRFNSANHYFDEDGNAFTGTPSAATVSGYTWSLTTNDYAEVSSDGTVTVNSLPTSDITLTLTCTANLSGGTPAAPSTLIICTDIFI